MLHSVLFDMQHDPILKKLILLSNTSLNLSEFEDESILSALSRDVRDTRHKHTNTDR